MIYTLSDAQELCWKFVESGRCKNDALVTARINEAQRRLIESEDWKLTVRPVRFSVTLNTVPLPREFEAARLASTKSDPTPIRAQSYEYIESGPGFQPMAAWDNSTDLIDMGDGHPTFYPIPAEWHNTGMYVFAASTSSADKDKNITLYGRKINGEELLTNGTPGVSVPINYWTGGEDGSLTEFPSPVALNAETNFPTGADLIQDIDGIKLPDGRKGYVSLYAVSADPQHMYFLSKYHPDETRPGYRRYRYLGADEDCATCIRCMCKLRYTPLSREDDVLLIQNPSAIKLMVMAIREENAGKLQESVGYEARARQLLSGQLKNDRKGAMPNVNIYDPFGGAAVDNIV